MNELNEAQDSMAEGEQVSLRARRDSLLAQKNALDSGIDALTTDNYKVERQTKELEIQLIDKTKKLRKLSEKAADLKRALLKPIADESGLLAEVDFLQEEKAVLVAAYNKISEELGGHISNLGNTILGIDFTKGEIAALKNKVTMIEYEVPQKFDELDYLIEKIEWTSKALTNLFGAMKAVEKTTKLSYYKKG
ncbi:MAG: hypothetical protein L7F77_07190 [Candidatus Magnetominusculus sp. LBB02]|nr:hypothetical protein [Candidatus Magnetominusculus sp. LBB02]